MDIPYGLHASLRDVSIITGLTMRSIVVGAVRYKIRQFRVKSKNFKKTVESSDLI